MKFNKKTKSVGIFITCVCIAAACAIVSARPLQANAADDSTDQVMILGDIAIRKSGDTSFDTEHDALFDAEPGDTVDLGLTLNTTQIKQQMQEYYDQAKTLDSNAGAAVLHETASSFTAELSFPDSMDLSGVDAPAVITANLTSYDPKTGKYDNIYEDTSHAVIDSNYQLDQCGKFNITDVEVKPADNTISIQMDLDVSKLNYTGDNPAGTYAYGHLVCLYEAIENTPDYLAAVIPGIKIKDSYDGSVNTVSGTVNGQFKTIVGGGNFSYVWRGKKVQFTWDGIQDTSMDGNDGTDANTDVSGITLSYYNSNAVPKPEPTPTAEPTVTPEPTTTPEPTVEPSTEPVPTATPTTTPEPTITPTAEPTPTAAPTVTPEPTTTPESTVEPSAEPVPTATPITTPEPTITPTADPTPSAAPTQTPQPTSTPSVEPTPTTTTQPSQLPDVPKTDDDQPAASPSVDAGAQPALPDTSDSSQMESGSKTPQTGVHTDLSAWIGIFSCAVVVIAAALVLRHRNKHSR
ncbi:MAG: hypothetical protein SOZ08_05190 [Erysipelotrichaceae bacterium]|nr:hypothetical protein [Erysipelotrichaceae bacterium]